jgi:hypothetical protein
MRPRTPEILAIRGLLLVGELSTTILTGGYILRKCYKYSRSQELWLKLMPFVILEFSLHRVKDE